MKSFVTLEQHRCIVCGTDYDTGAVLLDNRLRDKFEKHTVTGTGLCAECKELYDDGYIALVGVDPFKSVSNGDVMNPQDAYRTGEIMHVTTGAFCSMFTTGLPTDKDGDPVPLAFVEQGVIEHIKALKNNSGSNDDA